MPRLRPATLNGVKGSGYAVITRRGSGLPDCSGVITVRLDDAMRLMDEFNRDREFTFSGTVVDGGRERQATLPVIPEFRLEGGSETSTITFVAAGGPVAAES